MGLPQIIYTKFSDYRSPIYRIITKIWSDKNGEKFVTKEPVYKEGVNHIKNICNNNKLLKKLNPCYKVCDCELLGDTIKFEYIDGPTLCDSMVMCLKENDILGFWRLIKIYKDILLSNKDNITDFEYTSQFEYIFGRIPNLKGSKSLKVMNLDAIPENIILKNNEYFIIDYEWVFDFPIPIDFMVYRNIHDLFYRKLCGFQMIINFQEIIDFFEISLEKNILDQSINSFLEMVTLEKKIDYLNLNNQFIKPRYNNNELKKVVEHRDKDIEELKKVVEHRDKDIEELKKVVEHRDKDIEELNRTIQILNKNRLETDIKLEKILDELNSIKSTHIYKILNKIKKRGRI